MVTVLPTINPGLTGMGRGSPRGDLRGRSPMASAHARRSLVAAGPSRRRGGRTLGIRRPRRGHPPHRGKQKQVHPSATAVELARAAAACVYSGSPYHCRRSKGQPPVARAKPASICPRPWSDEEATQALRAAMQRGSVSEAWEDGFPRYVWHRDGNILYEARHIRGPLGSFYAYPIENFQAPRGLLI